MDDGDRGGGRAKRGPGARVDDFEIGVICFATSRVLRARIVLGVTSRGAFHCTRWNAAGSDGRKNDPHIANATHTGAHPRTGAPPNKCHTTNNVNATTVAHRPTIKLEKRYTRARHPHASRPAQPHELATRRIGFWNTIASAPIAPAAAAAAAPRPRAVATCD